MLKALLSTCVGVVLFDRVAQTGGLIHLLLPEPNDPDNPWQPEAYASTGLPLFIRKLCEAGAETGRLQAYVAGGGLIGAVSETDLALDIGGRTADKVMGILAREGIALRRCETGGMSSMAITLDVSAWVCNIEPLIRPPRGEGERLQKPTENEISRAIAVLRPVPQIVLKIVRMIGDNRYRLDEVAAEIRQEQVITARLLNVANSALFSCKGSIESVDQALMVLGEKMLLQLVMTSSMEMFLRESAEGYSLCRGMIYQHAVGVAMAAEKISRTTGRSQPAIAYTAGLLHDIGKVVLDHFVARNFPFLYRRTQTDRMNLEEAELDILGIGHAEAGGRLADLWLIPRNVAEAIRYHHNPEKAVYEPDLAHIVHLADFIVSSFHVSNTLESRDISLLGPSLERLGMNAGALAAIVDGISWNAISAFSPLSS